MRGKKKQNLFKEYLRVFNSAGPACICNHFSTYKATPLIFSSVGRKAQRYLYLLILQYYTVLLPAIRY